MRHPILDLTHQTFGRLIVLREVASRISNYVKPDGFKRNLKDRIWLCRCECGNETQVLQTNLRRKTGTRSCGCKRHEITRDLKSKCVGEITGKKWSSIRIGARKRNLSFTVTKEYAWNLFLLQGRKCALSGVPISFAELGRELSEGTASLDRIDSNKGYDVGNVQWVHKDVNIAKQDLTDGDFIAMCASVTDYQRSKAASLN